MNIYLCQIYFCASVNVGKHMHYITSVVVCLWMYLSICAHVIFICLLTRFVRRSTLLEEALLWFLEFSLSCMLN